MAPPNSNSFSVSVVLPASGWEMIAKVRRRATSLASGDAGCDSVGKAMSDMGRAFGRESAGNQGDSGRCAAQRKLPYRSGEGRPPCQNFTRGDDPACSGGYVMAWAVLFVAGLMEIGWAIGLKYTEGFSRLVPSVLTLTCMVCSIVLLGLAVKTLPIGTAYAMWTGIGAVGTAILGIILFGDPATALRLACIGLIVAGIVGLKLVT